MSKRFGEKKSTLISSLDQTTRKTLKKISILVLFTIVFIYVRDRNTKIWGKYENLVRFQRSSKGPDRKKKRTLLRRI